MKTRSLGLALAVGLLATLVGAVAVSGSEPSTMSPSRAPVTSQNSAIVVDHTCTDLSMIPDYWLDEAKKLAIHYAHTSHGSQINSGLQALEQLTPTYAYSLFYAGSSPPSTLSCAPGNLCIYDGNPPETYIEPDDYWSTESGQNRTRAVADTGLFDYSMWSWCGQQSSNPTSTVQIYLDTLTTFEQEYPTMRFILMTGHTDGGSETLIRNNNMVRQYAVDHGMVLFDFADIETYTPDGSGPYYNDSEGSCEWCAAWCADHPSTCADLPASCAHTDYQEEQKLFCKLKANAFWWMMARLAGWQGISGGELDLSPSTKIASVPAVTTGEIVEYTIRVANGSGAIAQTVYLTDEIPSGLVYVPGSLIATQGTADDSLAPELHWTGTLTPSPVVTITYAVTASDIAPAFLVNTATIGAPGGQSLSRPATVLVNGYSVYLPLAVKGAAR